MTGARQIGKSYLIRYLGETEYTSLVEINLLNDKEAKRVLAEAQNAQDFINRLVSLTSKPFIEGDTLVFIGEIQELPDVITYAKFLIEDGRYDYAFSSVGLGAFSRLPSRKPPRTLAHLLGGILYAPWYATLCFESLNYTDDFFLK